MGRRCILHERAHLGAPGSDPSPASFGVLLEDYITVEVGAVIEAGETTISEGSIVGIGARVGRGARIGKVRLVLHTGVTSCCTNQVF